MQGENPSVQEALDVYHILTEGNNDLRQPVGLETQLLKESSMDSEVGMSMLQLLSVCAFISCFLIEHTLSLAGTDRAIVSCYLRHFTKLCR